MAKIDLAIHDFPRPSPLMAAAKRSAKIWLCLILIAGDMLALLVGFAVGAQIEQIGRAHV